MELAHVTRTAGNIRELKAELDCHLLVGGASIYPFVQNLLLGLRAEGLGAAFTALHLATQDQVRELLGIPDGYLVAGHIGVGRPAAPFRTRLSRNPVEDFATLDTFSGPPLKARPTGSTVPGR